jgi:hypothetical protein
MAELNDYFKTQCIEIIEFDIKLIEKHIDLEPSVEICTKMQLDLFALKYDMELVLEMLKK